MKGMARRRRLGDVRAPRQRRRRLRARASRRHQPRLHPRRVPRALRAALRPLDAARAGGGMTSAGVRRATAAWLLGERRCGSARSSPRRTASTPLPGRRAGSAPARLPRRPRRLSSEARAQLRRGGHPLPVCARCTGIYAAAPLAACWRCCGPAAAAAGLGLGGVAARRWRSPPRRRRVTVGRRVDHRVDRSVAARRDRRAARLRRSGARLCRRSRSAERVRPRTPANADTTLRRSNSETRPMPPDSSSRPDPRNAPRPRQSGPRPSRSRPRARALRRGLDGAGRRPPAAARLGRGLTCLFVLPLMFGLGLLFDGALFPMRRCRRRR